MKIRTLRNQLIDMTEKEVTTVLTPTGTYQILAHTKDKRKELSWENIAQSKKLFVFFVPYRLQLGIQRKSKSLKCHQMQR